MSFLRTKSATPDGQMELMEHLAELRTRLLRSIMYVAVGMSLTYILFPWMYIVIAAPIQSTLKLLPGSIIQFDNISQPFMLRLQVAFIAGLIVAFPMVILELWGFIAPALTEEERRPIAFLAPFTFLLFVIGALVGYACLPATFQWMGSFADDVPGAALLLNAQQYLLLAVKIILAFGVSFELPLVLLFLARLGLITSDMMTQYWRHAIVLVAAASAVITPSADPISMLMMAIPMGILYIMSIGLVRAFEPRADGRSALSIATMLLIACVPLAILAGVGFYLWRTNPLQYAPTKHLAETPAGTTPAPVPVPQPAAIETPKPPSGDTSEQAVQLAREAQALAERASAMAKEAVELARKAKAEANPGSATASQSATTPQSEAQPTATNPTGATSVPSGSSR